jgi:hypothetical protein
VLHPRSGVRFRLRIQARRQALHKVELARQADAPQVVAFDDAPPRRLGQRGMGGETGLLVPFFDPPAGSASTSSTPRAIAGGSKKGTSRPVSPCVTTSATGGVAEPTTTAPQAMLSSIDQDSTKG